MYHQKSPSLTPEDKRKLKIASEKHIFDLAAKLQSKIDDYNHRIQEQRDLIPQLKDTNINVVDPNTEAMAVAVARINLYQDQQQSLATIQDNPYFVRLTLTWNDTNTTEDIFISKYSLISENIYSWVSPIATLRYSGIGEAEYQKPMEGSREANISLKQDYIITNREIVFMAHEDINQPRQMIFQKHIDARREFLLPEIVAELDKLQDQIIRSDPQGHYLISGPAGSGKTTLALHRIAYLVLTPEFKDFFTPEKIIVFVADERATRYFAGLLPELGINNVQVTTFMEWGLMIANSRFRTTVPKRFKALNQNAAEEFIANHNPLPDLHPHLVWEEYRKFKQSMAEPLTNLKEGFAVNVYPALTERYLLDTTGIKPEIVTGFQKYWKWQQQNRFLDEVDVIILLKSLERPINPFVHIVVDEVQNWLPDQLEFISTLVSRVYNSITFVGDINQKTRPFTINSWEEIGSDHPQTMQLLQVYRNTKQILEHLKSKGYNVSPAQENRQGLPVQEFDWSEYNYEHQLNLIKEIIADSRQRGATRIAVLSKYRDQLTGFEHLAYEDEEINVLPISAAQGLEFHTVIVLNVGDLEVGAAQFIPVVGHVSAAEYAAQNKHLYYVAATRAQERLVLVK